MEISEVLKMGDLISGKLQEDASLIEAKAGKDEEDENNIKKPLKNTIDSNRAKELSLETKLKQLKQAKQNANTEEEAAKLEAAIKSISIQISDLKAKRKESKNMMSVLSEEDAKASTQDSDETDDNMIKDAADFDSDIASGQMNEGDTSVYDVTVAKAKAVITACENKKEGIKE